MILVSSGFDCMLRDLLGDMFVSNDLFYYIAKHL